MTPLRLETKSLLPETTSMYQIITGPLDNNCFVLVDSAHTTDSGAATAMVIDPGLGAAAQVTQLAEKLNVQVTAVVLTHGHIDHIRDAAQLQVPVYIHPADRPMLTAPWNRTQLGALFDVENMGVPEDIRDVEHSIQMGGVTWKVHHMPGHSPGSVMYRVPGLVIGGDVLFPGGVGRTDLPGSSPEDMALSIKRLVHEFDDADRVLTGHGEEVVVGQEKRTNPYLHSVV